MQAFFEQNGGAPAAVGGSNSLPAQSSAQFGFGSNNRDNGFFMQPTGFFDLNRTQSPSQPTQQQQYNPSPQQYATQQYQSAVNSSTRSSIPPSMTQQQQHRPQPPPPQPAPAPFPQQQAQSSILPSRPALFASVSAIHAEPFQAHHQQLSTAASISKPSWQPSLPANHNATAATPAQSTTHLPLSSIPHANGHSNGTAISISNQQQQANSNLMRPNPATASIFQPQLAPSVPSHSLNGQPNSTAHPISAMTATNSSAISLKPAAPTSALPFSTQIQPPLPITTIIQPSHPISPTQLQSTFPPTLTQSRLPQTNPSIQHPPTQLVTVPPPSTVAPSSIPPNGTTQSIHANGTPHAFSASSSPMQHPPSATNHLPPHASPASVLSTPLYASPATHAIKPLNGVQSILTPSPVVSSPMPMYSQSARKLTVTPERKQQLLAKAQTVYKNHNRHARTLTRQVNELRTQLITQQHQHEQQQNVSLTQVIPSPPVFSSDPEASPTLASLSASADPHVIALLENSKQIELALAQKQTLAAQMTSTIERLEVYVRERVEEERKRKRVEKDERDTKDPTRKKLAWEFDEAGGEEEEKDELVPSVPSLAAFDPLTSPIVKSLTSHISALQHQNSLTQSLLLLKNNALAQQQEQHTMLLDSLRTQINTLATKAERREKEMAEEREMLVGNLKVMIEELATENEGLKKEKMQQQQQATNARSMSASSSSPLLHQPPLLSNGSTPIMNSLADLKRPPALLISSPSVSPIVPQPLHHHHHHHHQSSAANVSPFVLPTPTSAIPSSLPASTLIRPPMPAATTMSIPPLLTFPSPSQLPLRSAVSPPVLSSTSSASTASTTASMNGTSGHMNGRTMLQSTFPSMPRPSAATSAPTSDIHSLLATAPFAARPAFLAPPAMIPSQ